MENYPDEGRSWLGRAARDNSGIRLSGFIIGAFLPFAMYFSSKSVTFFVGLAAILACASAGVAALSLPRHRPKSLVGMALAFCGFAVLSLGWSVDPFITAHTLAACMIVIGVCVLLYLGYRQTLPYRFGFGIAIGLICAGAFAALQFLFGFNFRSLFDLRADMFTFNRAMVFQAALLWPMAMLIERRDRRLAALAVATVVVALLLSQSGAAMLGVIAGTAIAALACWRPGVAIAILALGVAVYGALAPWLGQLLESLKSLPFFHLLEGAHATERIDIWRAFGALARENIWVGIGFGGSEVAAAHGTALRLPAELRPLLGNNHPHNAFLQAWVELGALGGAAFTALCVALVLSILRMPARLQPIAAGFGAQTLAIAGTSHGAWQAWWLTTVFAIVAIMLAAYPTWCQASCERGRAPAR